ncbi:MAG: tetratricopeptide repeat protein [Planctomycetota bacterium]
MGNKTAESIKGDGLLRQGGRGISGEYRMLAVLMGIGCVVILAAFWSGLGADAVMIDDNQYFIDNPLVRNPSWGSVQRFLSEVLKPSTVAGYYQPFTMISLMLDYAMGGRENNLLPFHRTSLILHMVNTCLIIFLLYRLFGTLWAGAAGMIFAVHPMTVESVVWISDRKTLLAAFFVLLCLICYLQYAEQRSWVYYAGCVVFYAGALMSKPTSIAVPGLLLVLDYWPLRRLQWRAVWEKVPFFIIGAGFGVIIYISQTGTAGTYLVEDQGPRRILLVICHNIVFYLRNIFWPVRLSSFYSYPQVSLREPAILTGVIGTVVLVVIMVTSLRWSRLFLAGMAFFVVAISPTLGVIRFSQVIAADKFAYVPSIGLLMMLTVFLAWLSKSDKKSKFVVRPVELSAIIFLLLIAESVGCWVYLGYWRDTKTLYRHMVEIRPRSATLNYNYGNLLMKEGRVEEAVGYLQKALEARPGSIDVHNNLGVALLALGRTSQAREHFEKVSALDANDIEARTNLATVLLLESRYDEAIEAYGHILELNPKDIAVLNGIGIAYWQQGKLEEAIGNFERVLEIEPDAVMTHYRLGMIYRTKGENDKAIRHLRRVVELSPGYVEGLNQLAETYVAAGQYEHAIAVYESVLTLARRSGDSKLAGNTENQIEKCRKEQAGQGN